jgi:hypothetical protein
MRERHISLLGGDLPETGAPRPPLESTEKAYEPGGISFFVVAAALAIIFAVFVAVWFIDWGLISYWTEPGERSHQADSYTTPQEKLPPEPRLDPLNAEAGSTGADVYARQAAFEEILTHYGPTENENFVRVPISVAMKQMAQDTRSDAAEEGDKQHNYGLIDGGEPNSGRLFQGKPSWFHKSY